MISQERWERLTAGEWLKLAFAAGHDPMVITQPDERQGLYTKQVNIDHDLSPGTPPSDKVLGEVIDVLIASGRHFDVRCLPVEKNGGAS